MIQPTILRKSRIDKAMKKTTVKYVNAIPDEYYEICLNIAQKSEERQSRLKPADSASLLPPSRSPGYRVIYSRWEGIKNGVLKRLWHEDPLLKTKEYRLVQVETLVSFRDDIKVLV